MAAILPIAVILITISLAQSHFVFDRIAVNNVWQSPTRFIRNKTYPFTEPTTPNTNVNVRNFLDPTYPTDIPESVRCGRGTMIHGVETEVLDVFAGDTIEVAHQRNEPSEWTDAMWYNCPDGRGSCDPRYAPGYMDINHPGPFLAHLSKVPDGQDVTTYDGSGEWTKIYTLGLELRNAMLGIHWLSYNDQQLPGRFLFKIPTQTPEGQYLLRLDLIWATISSNSAYPYDSQLYPSCTQISVKSNSTGALPPGIKIPDDFSVSSPGMTTSLEMYRELLLDSNYTYPGGLIWDGVSLSVDKPRV